MKKRWFWIITAAVITVGVGVWLRKPDTPPTVRTMVLTPTRVEQTVSCNGVVEFANGLGVFAPIGCHIQEVCVSEGQRVRKGDVLAVVDKETTDAETDDPVVKLALAGMQDTLTAPEDGIVAKVSAQAGKTLKVGTPCALLVRPCDVQVSIAIREKDLRVLHEGMSVRISGDGLEKASYQGVLSEIACTASSGSSATVVAGVVIPDEGVVDDSFRLGLSAKASVITSVTEAGYVIPYEAVLADEKGSYIYVLQDGVARLWRVEGAVQVPSGLMLTHADLEGARIILDPEKVTGDGAAVTEAVS